MAGATLHLSVPVDDLVAARRFYEDGFGCTVGRTRAGWIDVWFFGLQLTLQVRPEEVRPVEEQGVRHFGVVLDDRKDYDALIDRLRSREVRWLSEPQAHVGVELSGKLAAKVADPSGNVIEIKHYPDAEGFTKPVG